MPHTWFLSLIPLRPYRRLRDPVLHLFIDRGVAAAAAGPNAWVPAGMIARNISLCVAHDRRDGRSVRSSLSPSEFFLLEEEEEAEE